MAANNAPSSREALYQEKAAGGRIRCLLCPRRCLIAQDATGFCGVRSNENGRLVAASWGRVAAVAIDPVEKKPLYHFYPGARTLSLGGIGCNLKCRHCQNASLSRAGIHDSLRELEALSPEEAVNLALARDCPLLVWTYNEPLINFEYILDNAPLARAAGLKTALVTAGGLSPEPLRELLPLVDAYRLDIKAFTPGVYERLTGFEFLPAVLEGARIARDAGCHLEIVTNVIPGWNDDEAQIRGLARFIRDELGGETPWHVTAYHPALELREPPTPAATIRRIVQLGREEGLKQVFSGNLADDADSATLCPGCGIALIRRQGFSVRENRVKKGRCPECGYTLNSYRE